MTQEELKVLLVRNGDKILILRNGVVEDTAFGALNKVAKSLISLYRLRGYMIYDYKQGDYAISFIARR
jgi:hypothetical protein